MAATPRYVVNVNVFRNVLITWLCRVEGAGFVDVVSDVDELLEACEKYNVIVNAEVLAEPSESLVLEVAKQQFEAITGGGIKWETLKTDTRILHVSNTRRTLRALVEVATRKGGA